ncbi:MAG: hypothetical protein Kow0098_28420 [Ignavibacteriaceae bacterium]
MKINLFQRVLIFLAATTGVLWTGSYTLRLLLTYGMFEQAGVEFKYFINDENLSALMQVTGISVTTTFFLYLAFILLFFLTLLIIRPPLRKNGWLFMILVIVLVTLPFELYLMTFDYDIITEFLTPGFNTEYITNIFRKRYSTLQGFSFGIILCYISIIYLAIFKPFSTKD